MDANFTKKIKAFLDNGKPTDQEIKDAAVLLLQCDPNRERGIYNSAMIRPKAMLPWIRTDLEKFYKIRMQGHEKSEIETFNNETIALVKETLSTIPEDVEKEDVPQVPVLNVRGRRADHDKLPEYIQALFERNSERWKKIRQLHNQLLLMISQPNYQACDGNELCHILRDADKAMREDYARYDSYVLTSGGKQTAVKDDVEVFTDNVKTIQNARTAITRGLQRKTQDEKSLKKIQDAVDTLKALKQKITPATAKKLEAINIKV